MPRAPTVIGQAESRTITWPRPWPRVGVPYVAMHWRASSHEMTGHAVYRDVVADVVTELRQRVGELTSRDAGEAQIVLDPGLGFAKRPEQSCVRVHVVAASLAAVRVAQAWGEGAAHAIPGGVPGP
jgi:dihydropteroate synthase